MQNNLENAVVTFESKDNNEKITINLSYDKETSNIDYSIKLGENIKKENNLDFIGFLAHSFLESLVMSTTDGKDKS